MKNYTMIKALAFKTGLIFVSNKFGHTWVELRYNGAKKGTWTLRQPFNKRDQKRLEYQQVAFTNEW